MRNFWIKTANRDIASTVKLQLGDIYKDNISRLNIGESCETKIKPSLTLKDDFILLKKQCVGVRAFNRLAGVENHMFRLNFHRVVKLRKRVRNLLRLKKGRENIKFLLRIDCFPDLNLSWRVFEKLHKILYEKKIPYLLAVIPRLCAEPFNPNCGEERNLSGDEVDFLKKITDEGAELAQHGCCHRVVRKNENTEFAGLSEEKITEKMEKGQAELHKYGFDIDYFIPPFDTIDEKAYTVIKKYVKLVSGGDNTAQILGYRLTPSYMHNCLYVPAYYPFYNKAQRIISYVEEVKKTEEEIFVPIVLHWNSEWGMSEFRYAGELAGRIQDSTVRWKDLLNFESGGKTDGK